MIGKNIPKNLDEKKYSRHTTLNATFKLFKFLKKCSYLDLISNLPSTRRHLRIFHLFCRLSESMCSFQSVSWVIQVSFWSTTGNTTCKITPHSISYSKFFLHFLSVYEKHSGACRNENDKYNDIGTYSVSSLTECLEKCDLSIRCGAVSWNGNTCYMTSSMKTTIVEGSWKCYSKGKRFCVPNVEI